MALGSAVSGVVEHMSPNRSSDRAPSRQTSFGAMGSVERPYYVRIQVAPLTQAPLR